MSAECLLAAAAKGTWRCMPSTMVSYQCALLMVRSQWSGQRSSRLQKLTAAGSSHASRLVRSRHVSGSPSWHSRLQRHCVAKAGKPQTDALVIAAAAVAKSKGAKRGCAGIFRMLAFWPRQITEAFASIISGPT